jgi:hypothetical protein
MRIGFATLAPFAALVQVLLSAGAPPSSVALAGLLGAVTTLVAFGVVLLVLAVGGPPAFCRGGLAPEAAETRLLVWQRNPDAAGHTRSRAPGRAAPTV